MPTATADISSTSRGNGYQHAPIAGTVIILCGVLLCLNATGYLVDGSSATGTTFAGVAGEYVDNSAGADAALNAKIYTAGQFKFTGTGFTRGTVGKDAYLVDNQTVGTSGQVTGTRQVRVGRFTEYVSATEMWVDIEPVAVRTELPMLFNVDVAGGTVAAALNLAASGVLYGGTNIYVLTVISVEAYVIASNLSAGRKVLTTDYTVAAGVITCVTDQSLNRLIIACVGYLR